jgi:hypothetical protein
MAQGVVLRAQVCVQRIVSTLCYMPNLVQSVSLLRHLLSLFDFLVEVCKRETMRRMEPRCTLEAPSVLALDVTSSSVGSSDESSVESSVGSSV